MKKKHLNFAWKWRLIFGSGAIVLVLAGWFTYQRVLAKTSTNDLRRQEIEKMAAEIKTKFPDIVEMEARHAIELMNDKKLVFIDVRRPEEQEQSMLPDAVPARTFLENPGKYKDYTKVGYCTIGYRSSIFAKKLKELGISIYSLRGGLLAWVHDGGKVYNDRGESFRIHVSGRPWNLGPERYEEVW